MVSFLIGLSAHLSWSRHFPTQILSEDLKSWAEASARAGSLSVRVWGAGGSWSVSVPLKGPRSDAHLGRGETLRVHLGDSVLTFWRGKLISRGTRQPASPPRSPFPFPEKFVRFVKKLPQGYLVAGPRLLVRYSPDGQELWRFKAPGSTSALFWDGSRAWLAWSERETGKAHLVALDDSGKELLHLEFTAEGEPAFISKIWSDGQELRVLCSRTLYVYKLEG